MKKNKIVIIIMLMKLCLHGQVSVTLSRLGDLSNSFCPITYKVVIYNNSGGDFKICDDDILLFNANLQYWDGEKWLAYRYLDNTIIKSMADYGGKTNRVISPNDSFPSNLSSFIFKLEYLSKNQYLKQKSVKFRAVLESCNSNDGLYSNEIIIEFPKNRNRTDKDVNKWLVTLDNPNFIYMQCYNEFAINKSNYDFFFNNAKHIIEKYPNCSYIPFANLILAQCELSRLNFKEKDINDVKIKIENTQKYLLDAERENTFRQSKKNISINYLYEKVSQKIKSDINYYKNYYRITDFQTKN